MIRKQAMPHRLGPKNIPLPQVPAKIGSLRNSNSTSTEGSFDEGLGKKLARVNDEAPLLFLREIHSLKFILILLINRCCR